MFERKEIEVIYQNLSQLKVPPTDQGLEIGQILNSICKKCVEALKDED